MKKAKIEIETIIESQRTFEKYICNFDNSKIMYTDKQKTRTKIKYNEEQMRMTKEGNVNYSIFHDGASVSRSLFKTKVDGNPFEFTFEIENKYYNVRKYDKILSIEFHYIREDKQLVKQNIKVEEK